MIDANEIRIEWRRRLDHGFEHAPPPAEGRDQVRAYILHGERASPELARVLDAAAGHSDAWDRAVASFFRHYAPAPCWGSRQARMQWQIDGGIEGHVL